MGSPEFSITLVPSSEIDLTSVALLELMRDGYGFQDDYEYLLDQARQEYDGDYSLCFFLYADEVIIGSLTASDGKLGNAKADLANYWERLDENSRNQLLTYSDQVVGINGIVILPQYQGLGLGQQLLTQMVEKLKPALIMGGTKTPSAVLARSRSLEKLGYRSFYGLAEVTPSQPQASTRIHFPFAKAHWATRSVTAEGIYLKSPDILRPDVPNVSKVPSFIAEAFRPVIEAQLSVGDTQTAVTTLLSIHSSVF